MSKKQKLDLTDFLTSPLRDEETKSVVNNLFNRFFSEERSVRINGQVGRKPTPETSDIAAPDFDRELNALVPALYYKTGVEETIFSFDDLVNRLRAIGVDTSELRDMLKEQSFNFAPPIDFDKFINYSNYYWIGQAAPLPELSWNPEVVPEYYVQARFANTSIFKMPVKLATTRDIKLWGKDRLPEKVTVTFDSSSTFSVTGDQGVLLTRTVSTLGAENNGVKSLNSLAPNSTTTVYVLSPDMSNAQSNGYGLDDSLSANDELFSFTITSGTTAFQTGDIFEIEIEYVSGKNTISFLSSVETGKGYISNIIPDTKLMSIDGVRVNLGDSILVWQQNKPEENGIYTVKNDRWVRRAQSDREEFLPLSSLVYVLSGSSHSGKTFVLSGRAPSFVLDDAINGTLTFTVQSTTAPSPVNDWQAYNFWIHREELSEYSTAVQATAVQAGRPIIEYVSDLQLNSFVDADSYPSLSGTAVYQRKTALNQIPQFDLFRFDGTHARATSGIFFYVEDPDYPVDIALQRRLKVTANSDFVFGLGIEDEKKRLLYWMRATGLETIWAAGPEAVYKANDCEAPALGAVSRRLYASRLNNVNAFYGIMLPSAIVPPLLVNTSSIFSVNVEENEDSILYPLFLDTFTGPLNTRVENRPPDIGPYWNDQSYVTYEPASWNYMSYIPNPYQTQSEFRLAGDGTAVETDGEEWVLPVLSPKAPFYFRFVFKCPDTLPANTQSSMYFRNEIRNDPINEFNYSSRWHSNTWYNIWFDLQIQITYNNGEWKFNHYNKTVGNYPPSTTFIASNVFPVIAGHEYEVRLEATLSRVKVYLKNNTTEQELQLNNDSYVDIDSVDLGEYYDMWIDTWRNSRFFVEAGEFQGYNADTGWTSNPLDHPFRLTLVEMGAINNPAATITPPPLLPIPTPEPDAVWIISGKGDYERSVYVSTDSVNWMDRHTPDAIDTYNIKAANTQILSVSDGYAGVQLSTNGYTWSQDTQVFPSNDYYINLYNPVHNGTIWLFAPVYDAAWTGARAYRSTNGTTWQFSTIPNFSGNHSELFWTGTAFLVTGGMWVHRSVDGINWTRTQLTGTSTSFRAFGKIGNRLILIGSHSAASRMLFSLDDGLTWAEQSLPSGNTASKFYKLFTNGNILIAYGAYEIPSGWSNGELNPGENRGIMYYTYDGINWNKVSSPAVESFVPLLWSRTDCAWNGSRFILVGFGEFGRMLTSIDGINWEDMPFALGAQHGTGIASGMFYGFHGITWFRKPGTTPVLFNDTFTGTQKMLSSHVSEIGSWTTSSNFEIDGSGYMVVDATPGTATGFTNRVGNRGEYMLEAQVIVPAAPSTDCDPIFLNTFTGIAGPISSYTGEIGALTNILPGWETLELDGSGNVILSQSNPTLNTARYAFNLPEYTHLTIETTLVVKNTGTQSRLELNLRDADGVNWVNYFNTMLQFPMSGSGYDITMGSQDQYHLTAPRPLAANQTETINLKIVITPKHWGVYVNGGIVSILNAEPTPDSGSMRLELELWADSNGECTFKISDLKIKPCANNLIDETVPTTSQPYSATNTNNATVNTTDWIVALNAGDTIELGTINLPGATATGDTYIKLLNPSNVLVAENDQYMNYDASYLVYVVPAGAGGNYTIKGGCWSATSCSGTVTWRVTPASFSNTVTEPPVNGNFELRLADPTSTYYAVDYEINNGAYQITAKSDGFTQVVGSGTVSSEQSFALRVEVEPRSWQILQDNVTLATFANPNLLVDPRAEISTTVASVTSFKFDRIRLTSPIDRLQPPDIPVSQYLKELFPPRINSAAAFYSSTVIRGAAPPPANMKIYDTFTDADGTLLTVHNGEQNAIWEHTILPESENNFIPTVQTNMASTFNMNGMITLASTEFLPSSFEIELEISLLGPGDISFICDNIIDTTSSAYSGKRFLNCYVSSGWLYIWTTGNNGQNLTWFRRSASTNLNFVHNFKVNVVVNGTSVTYFLDNTQILTRTLSAPMRGPISMYLASFRARLDSVMLMWDGAYTAPRPIQYEDRFTSSGSLLTNHTPNVGGYRDQDSLYDQLTVDGYLQATGTQNVSYYMYPRPAATDYFIGTRTTMWFSTYWSNDYTNTQDEQFAITFYSGGAGGNDGRYVRFSMYHSYGVNGARLVVHNGTSIVHDQSVSITFLPWDYALQKWVIDIDAVTGVTLTQNSITRLSYSGPITGFNNPRVEMAGDVFNKRAFAFNEMRIK
jgi:hypothetical protein